MLATTNPYTGMTTLADPALAGLIMVNEGGLTPLIHKGVPDELRPLFADWLAKKYGAKAALVKAWDGELGVEESLEGKSVSADIHGSGDIRLPSVQAGQVNISIKGSGDVTAAGNADTVDIEVMGSGDVRSRKLIAREANVKIMASGDVDVYASERITASVTGSGDIRYAGSPMNVSRTVRGSGSIEAM